MWSFLQHSHFNSESHNYSNCKKDVVLWIWFWQHTLQRSFPYQLEPHLLEETELTKYRIQEIHTMVSILVNIENKKPFCRNNCLNSLIVLAILFSEEGCSFRVGTPENCNARVVKEMLITDLHIEWEVFYEAALPFPAIKPLFFGFSNREYNLGFWLLGRWLQSPRTKILGIGNCVDTFIHFFGVRKTVGLKTIKPLLSMKLK